MTTSRATPGTRQWYRRARRAHFFQYVPFGAGWLRTRPCRSCCAAPCPPQSLRRWLQQCPDAAWIW